MDAYAEKKSGACPHCCMPIAVNQRWRWLWFAAWACFLTGRLAPIVIQLSAETDFWLQLLSFSLFTGIIAISLFCVDYFVKTEVERSIKDSEQA